MLLTMTTTPRTRDHSRCTRRGSDRRMNHQFRRVTPVVQSATPEGNSCMPGGANDNPSTERRTTHYSLYASGWCSAQQPKDNNACSLSRKRSLACSIEAHNEDKTRESTLRKSQEPEHTLDSTYRIA
nr:hypothetical protein [Solanum melongena]